MINTWNDAKEHFASRYNNVINEKNGEEVKPVTLSAEDFISGLTNTKCLFITPKTFAPVGGSYWLFDGATHFILSEAKEGKSTFVRNSLANVDKKVIVFDGDNNGQEMVDEAGDNTTWLQPTNADAMVDLFLIQAAAGVDFSNYIFVIDAMQNFTDSSDMDTNKGILRIITRLKKLTITGATLVVLHHVTATGNPDKPFKAKGNEQGIYSNADIVYGFRREDGLTAIKSRINSISNGYALGLGKTKPKKTAKDKL